MRDLTSVWVEMKRMAYTRNCNKIWTITDCNRVNLCELLTWEGCKPAITRCNKNLCNDDVMLHKQLLNSCLFYSSEKCFIYHIVGADR